MQEQPYLLIANNENSGKDEFIVVRKKDKGVELGFLGFYVAPIRNRLINENSGLKSFSEEYQRTNDFSDLFIYSLMDEGLKVENGNERQEFIDAYRDFKNGSNREKFIYMIRNIHPNIFLYNSKKHPKIKEIYESLYDYHVDEIDNLLTGHYEEWLMEPGIQPVV